MILVNGQVTEFLPVSDRGLQYGDGVWETIAIEKGQLVWLESHLDRLHKGLNILGINNLDFDVLKKEIIQVTDSSEHPRDSKQSFIQNKILKIIITRGSGGRGYSSYQCDKPTRILSLHPWPDYPESYKNKGVIVTLCETHLSQNPLLAGFKHLNRLEQVLARTELGSEYQEGLVRDVSGHVIEATMSNLFVIKNDQTIMTPDLSQCGIEGIARSQIIDKLKKMEIDVRICSVGLDDVLQAQSLFLSNSIIKIWPIKQFQAVTYEIPTVIQPLNAVL